MAADTKLESAEVFARRLFSVMSRADVPDLINDDRLATVRAVLKWVWIHGYLHDDSTMIQDDPSRVLAEIGGEG